jgi:hypothetical protein
MKTPAQLAFEAYQQAMAADTLHKQDTSTIHLQPWEAVDSRQKNAWEAAIKAAFEHKES